MTAYLHASHHGRAVKKICNSRKLAFLYFKNLYFNTFGYFNIFETLWKPAQLTSGCFLCFISFNNRTFCLTGQKFPTSRHYFDPWNRPLVKDSLKNKTKNNIKCKPNTDKIMDMAKSKIPEKHCKMYGNTNWC